MMPGGVLRHHSRFGRAEPRAQTVGKEMMPGGVLRRASVLPADNCLTRWKGDDARRGITTNRRRWEGWWLPAVGKEMMPGGVLRLRPLYTRVKLHTLLCWKGDDARRGITTKMVFPSSARNFGRWKGDDARRGITTFRGYNCTLHQRIRSWKGDDARRGITTPIWLWRTAFEIAVGKEMMPEGVLRLICQLSRLRNCLDVVERR